MLPVIKLIPVSTLEEHAEPLFDLSETREITRKRLRGIDSSFKWIWWTSIHDT